MYNAKQAKKDYEIAMESKFQNYWTKGRIKTYNVEKLIKEASLRGCSYISLCFVLFQERYSLYFGGTEDSFEDFASCLEYYGYDVSIPTSMCNGDVKKVDIKISW